MNKIIMVGRAVLAAGIIATPIAVMSAGTVSAQPIEPALDVCFNGPYPSPPPPWGPGMMSGCVNPDSWFETWGWRPAGPSPNWQYVGPGCEYTSNSNWQYNGPDCQRENP